MSEDIHTGGCQCGAIRFRFSGTPRDASICHCRMCQKAFGNLTAPLVSVRGTDFAWTRGEPKRFASSSYVKRGFCGNCGTPLSYEAPDGIAVSIGAFDHPERFAPTIQFGVEAKVSWFDDLHTLPARLTMDDIVEAPFLANLDNRQHPDHDTDDWTPEEGK